MFFSYNQYVRGCFTIPVVTILFSGVAFISALLSFARKTYKKEISISNIVSNILIVSVIIFFIAMSAGRLSHGGYYLASESESDAVEIRGYIVTIKNLGRFEFPELKSDYGYGEDNGVQLTIGDIQCSAPVCGDFAVGDYVAVVYLPKSGYVLSILLCEDCV